MKKLLNNKLFSLFITLFLLLYVSICISISKKSSYDIDEELFTGFIEDVKIKDGKIVYRLKGKERLICNYYKDDIDLKDLKTYPIGSKVEIKGKLKKPLNNTIPNTFNYKKYLYNNDIFYTCTIDEMRLLEKNKNLFKAIKNYIIIRIMNFKTKDYLSTMILGDKSLLDSDTIEAYRNNGVVHLFAISGMHIGLFSTIMLFIFKKIGLKEKASYPITIAFLWFYAFLTGFSGSVIRACLLFTTLSINKIFKLELSTKKCLLITGAIIVFIKPFIIFDTGFLFSFTTTFGLVSSSKILAKHKIIGTSIVAFLYSLPLIINNFYKFNLCSIFFNIIFVPFVSCLIYPLCLLTFMIRGLEPLLKMLIDLLEYLNAFCSNIDALVIIVPKLPIIFIAFYYVILYTTLAKKFYLTTIFSFSIILAMKLTPFLDSNSYVEFLDVGQGDSCLLRSKFNREVVLIDSGGVKSYSGEQKYYISSNTVNYLHSIGINKIDAIISSHGDFDHIGDIKYLLKNLKVEEIVLNGGPINELEDDLIKTGLVKKDVELKYLKLSKLDHTIKDDENYNSSIYKLEMDYKNFLFMGDAPKEVEREIIDKYDLDIDVVKIGHHGSKTSSDKRFLKSIGTNEAIISSGRNNLYNHPNKETLEVLDDLKIRYFNTQNDGTIKYILKNGNVTIKTFPP